jgi:DNA-binding PadR family transcriptional regulator
MQNMRVHGELPLVKLYPTGKPTLERMLAKGWIEVGGSPETYRITSAGEAALKANIPTYRRKRTSPVELGLKGSTSDDQKQKRPLDSSKGSATAGPFGRRGILAADRHNT